MALAFLVACAVAVAFGLVWRREARVTVAAVRRAGAPPRPWLPVTAGVVGEVLRLGRALEERTEELARLRRADALVVDVLPDPLLVLAVDRSVVRANAAARAAFGTEIGAVLRHPSLRAAIDRALAGGGAQRADVALPVPVAREVQATVVRLEQPLTEGGRLIVVLSDRSRERAVERTRADFVANASHELRTPLASLIGFIDTLRGPAADDPPAQARFLAIMAEQAARMNRLIDDLLSLSRIEISEHQRPEGRVDFGGLVERIAAGFEPAVAARRQMLEVAVAADLPAVLGDEDQLAQVLQNLLDNAVKYGREGGRVRVRAAAESGGRWPARPGAVVSVADDGRGIPKAHLPRLTERFYRVDKGRSRAVGGTGLGLAIVKHIVNRHRGQLAVDSVEGEGATFSVWLPAA